MTKQGWRTRIVEAVAELMLGEETRIDLMAAYLEEVDNARQALRDKGYGCIGMPIERQVEEVPSRR